MVLLSLCPFSVAGDGSFITLSPFSSHVSTLSLPEVLHSLSSWKCFHRNSLPSIYSFGPIPFYAFCFREKNQSENGIYFLNSSNFCTPLEQKIKQRERESTILGSSFSLVSNLTPANKIFMQLSREEYFIHPRQTSMPRINPHLKNISSSFPCHPPPSF